MTISTFASALVTVAVVLSALPCDAQPIERSYIGLTLGAAAIDADIATGLNPAGGLVVGTSLSSRVTIEGELLLPTGHATRTWGGADDTPFFWTSMPSDTRPEDRDLYGVWELAHAERTVHRSFAGVAIYQVRFQRVARLGLGVLAGLSAQHVTDREERTIVRAGALVPPSALIPIRRVEVNERTIGGPVLGLQLTADVTRHLSVVPDLRVHYGSLGDEINNVIVPSVRVVWRF